MVASGIMPLNDQFSSPRMFAIGLSGRTRRILKEVGVTAQQAIERVVREEKLAGKGKLKV